MTLLVPDVGEQIMLEYIVNQDAPEDLVLRLYTNNLTPQESDTTGDYTEASGFGYASVTLTPASWAFVQGAPSTATFTEVTFTFTGALGNVYGYYINRSTGTELMWAERFVNGPFDIQNNGDEIKVTPRITLKDEGE